MYADAVDRLTHLKQAIGNVRTLLAGKAVADIRSDDFVRAATERFLEVVSEASRHIPAEWKHEHGANVPWRDIANLGNLLRHAYQLVDVNVLWSIYEKDLDPLEHAIDAMIAAQDK